MMSRIVLVIGSLGIACSSREPAPRDPPPQVPLAGSSTAPADAMHVPADATLKQHMAVHFAVVSDLQRAIARGHLDVARDRARWLLDHEEVERDGWKPFVTELRDAAREVGTAPDLPTAGALAARLGRACSRCHEATSAVVTFAWEPAPDDGPALQIQMKRHQWAAARLWEGLVGPSDEMWRQGASVLSSARLEDFAATGPAAPRGDIPALAEKVRELAKQAREVTGADERATLYGRLLSTCAACHQLARPGPARSK